MRPFRQAYRTTILALAELLGSLGLRRLLLTRSLPPMHETLTLPDCTQRIDIRIDQHGVPHIYAADTADLFLAQGYCHARDRLWQMELNRRLGRGELAELLGPRALDTDRLLRRLGFRHDAEIEAAKLEPDVRAVLHAYAAGVNAYITHHRLPIEFTSLRSWPRPWHIVDSLAFARYMGWTLTVNAETERRRSVASLCSGDVHRIVSAALRCRRLGCEPVYPADGSIGASRQSALRRPDGSVAVRRVSSPALQPGGGGGGDGGDDHVGAGAICLRFLTVTAR